MSPPKKIRRSPHGKNEKKKKRGLHLGLHRLAQAQEHLCTCLATSATHLVDVFYNVLPRTKLPVISSSWHLWAGKILLFWSHARGTRLGVVKNEKGQSLSEPFFLGGAEHIQLNCSLNDFSWGWSFKVRMIQPLRDLLQVRRWAQGLPSSSPTRRTPWRQSPWSVVVPLWCFLESM